MPATTVVSYLRVSTVQQGRSGLGLEAQRKTVLDYLRSSNTRLVGEFVEVESGRKSDRPQLQRALAQCRIHGATLVVAKLDRLSRNAHFLLGLKEAGVDFVACDIPSANRITVSILAVVAEEEARMISVRTKAALEAVRARGVRLGSPRNLTKRARSLGAKASGISRSKRAMDRSRDLAPLIDDIRQTGCSTMSAIAAALNARTVPAPRGGKWSHVQVRRVMARFTAAASD